jgi:hypothetical protein
VSNVSYELENLKGYGRKSGINLKGLRKAIWKSPTASAFAPSCELQLCNDSMRLMGLNTSLHFPFSGILHVKQWQYMI